MPKSYGGVLLEITRRRLDRYEDRHDLPFFDKLFDPNAKPSMLFRQLQDIYLAEKTEEFDANNVSKKRLDKITAIADCLCEIIGQSTPVEKIDDEHVQRARNLLAKCPTNRLKIYPQLSLEAGIIQAAKQTLSPITQSVYLDTLPDILKVGVRTKDFVAEAATDDEKVNRIHSIVQAMRTSLQFVVIKPESEDDPQIIFETLNARGLS
ncbi:hypothetical protein [Hyphomicrobium sp. ghe19]|uniref:hypothetical protein n=1 Tax=Hyphomicrobium sp. ghe19 TaxID=2682968 RepID=UPI0013678D30|nr:hypothetical protein HYPP_04047 [Hyphomicrobium sp. ghe19]